MAEKQLITTEDPRMAVATSTQDGLFGSADRTKLTGIETGATKNTADNIMASAIIAAKAVGDALTVYPFGRSMFSTTATGWPEAAGLVETVRVTNTENAQFFQGRNNNRYTRYWNGALTTPAWTAWVNVGSILHNSTHFTNGNDPITPADIGAYPSTGSMSAPGASTDTIIHYNFNSITNGTLPRDLPRRRNFVLVVTTANNFPQTGLLQVIQYDVSNYDVSINNAGQYCKQFLYQVGSNVYFTRSGNWATGVESWTAWRQV